MKIEKVVYLLLECMPITLRFSMSSILLTVMALTAPVADAESNKQFGGEGFLQSDYSNSCFHSFGGNIKEICVKYKVHWKLWTLMGEPVGNYTIQWQLTSIDLTDPKRKIVSSYQADSVPEELKSSLGSIEFYLQGVAEVNDSRIYHQFDTGVPVRAGLESSYNVPGSPDWKELFTTNYASCEGVVPRHFLDGASAKKMFSNGIKLSSLQLCKTAGFSELGLLNASISGLCSAPGSDKKYMFCPAKNKKIDKIGDAFDNMENKLGKTEKNTPIGNVDSGFKGIESYRAEQERIRILEENAAKERAERRNSYALICNYKFSEQNRCSIAACGDAPEKTIKSLGFTPIIRRRGWFRIRINEGAGACDSYYDLDLDRFRRHEISIPNPKYLDWEVCQKNISEKCAAGGEIVSSVSECVDGMEHAYNLSKIHNEVMPKTETTIMDKVNKAAKDLLRCKPERNEQCSPRKTVSPGGLRGKNELPLNEGGSILQ